jgi:hypothetical protein
MCSGFVLHTSPNHHRHKRYPEGTPEICGAVGEKGQVILMWVRAPSVGDASHRQRLRVTRVKPWLWYAYSKMHSFEVWARRYGNCVVSRSCFVQQWHGSGSQSDQGFNMHNFLNTCPNGTNKESIGIYKTMEWLRVSTREHTRIYDVLKLLEASNPKSKGKMSTWPQLLK